MSHGELSMKRRQSVPPSPPPIRCIPTPEVMVSAALCNRTTATHRDLTAIVPRVLLCMIRCCLYVGYLSPPLQHCQRKLDGHNEYSIACIPVSLIHIDSFVYTGFHGHLCPQQHCTHPPHPFQYCASWIQCSIKGNEGTGTGAVQ